MDEIEQARGHVRVTGHTLSFYLGARPWSPIRLFCKDCAVSWHVRKESRSQEVWVEILLELNQTERQIPTWWERLGKLLV